MKRDDGFTLIEFMIATAIGGILMVAVFGVFRDAFATVRAVSDTYSADMTVQTVISYLGRDANGAARNPASGPKLLDAGTGTGLTLHVPVLTPGGEGTTRIVYQYDAPAGTLTRTVSVGGSTRVTVIARNLRKNSSATVFGCLPGPLGCDATATSVEVTLPLSIDGVEVTRTVSLALRVASQ